MILPKFFNAFWKAGALFLLMVLLQHLLQFFPRFFSLIHAPFVLLLALSVLHPATPMRFLILGGVTADFMVFTPEGLYGMGIALFFISTHFFFRTLHLGTFFHAPFYIIGGTVFFFFILAALRFLALKLLMLESVLRIIDPLFFATAILMNIIAILFVYGGAILMKKTVFF